MAILYLHVYTVYIVCVYCAGMPGARQSETSPNKVSEHSSSDGQGWLELSDLTEGQSVFKILPTPISSPPTGQPTFQMRVDQYDDTGTTPQLTPIPSEDGAVQSARPGFGTSLSHGIQFQTGRLVWSLTALPQDQVLTAKMFRAAHEGRLADLRGIIDSSLCIDSPTPFVFVTSPSEQLSQYNFSTLSIMTEGGIDVNTEYRPPTSNGTCLSQRSSTVLSPTSPSSAPPLPHLSPYLLLHIAVVSRDLDMVLYLLEKGAAVRQLLCMISYHVPSLS